MNVLHKSCDCGRSRWALSDSSFTTASFYPNVANQKAHRLEIALEIILPANLSGRGEPTPRAARFVVDTGAALTVIRGRMADSLMRTLPTIGKDYRPSLADGKQMSAGMKKGYLYVVLHDRPVRLICAFMGSNLYKSEERTNKPWDLAEDSENDIAFESNETHILGMSEILSSSLLSVSSEGLELLRRKDRMAGDPAAEVFF